MDIKLKKYGLYIILLLLTIFLLLVFTSKSNANSINDHIIEIDNLDDLWNTVKDEKKLFIYIGSPTCPDCRDFYPVLEQSVLDNNVTIRYLNTGIRYTEEGYNNMSNFFNLTWIPALYYLEDGSIVNTFGYEFHATSDKVELSKCKDKLDDFFNLNAK